MFKILRNFLHLTEYFVEGEIREVRSDMVAGLTKEGYIEKAKPADVKAAAV